MINLDHDPGQLACSWANQPRWNYVKRPYTAEDVIRLRGSVIIEYTLARRGAERLWRAVHSRDFVPALGAMSGNQAVQMAQAGLEAIYCSGWQVAADANLSGETYPDLSLYPSSSVPSLVRRINNALQRADQIHACEGKSIPGIDWYVPIVADAEAGFGGNLNAFELMKHMIEAGAAGVHFEDQLSSAKKCGHMGGKVLVPTREFIEKLVAARLATDVMGVPTVIIARTDADSATLLTSDVDERDRPFITGERTAEGFFQINGGLDCAIARGVAYAPYADMIWCETSHPDIDEARKFAEGVHKAHPGKLLAYNCSPSFNWKARLDDVTISKFQRELGAMGYRFQFITLAGFHALNTSMFELARSYRHEGMTGYVRLQQREFELEQTHGYSAVKHQRFVGTKYFDEVATVVSGGTACTTALKGSTEEEQFVESASGTGNARETRLPQTAGGNGQSGNGESTKPDRSRCDVEEEPVLTGACSDF
jgi:isocitrate lyase